MSNGFPGPAPGPPGPPVPIWPPAEPGLAHTRRVVKAALGSFGHDATYVENDPAATQTALRLRIRAPEPELGEMFYNALGRPEDFPKHPQVGEFILWAGEPFTIKEATVIPGRVELRLQKQ